MVTKTERRIAIVKDVISQILAKKLKLKTKNGYVIPIAKNRDGYTDWYTLPTDCSLQKVVDIVQKKCNVCAMGSLLLSHARLYNKINCDDILSSYASQDDVIIDTLKGYFDEKTLRNIEAVFENFTETYDNRYIDDGVKTFRTKSLLDAK